jgi:hypothetical protein
MINPGLDVLVHFQDNLKHFEVASRLRAVELKDSATAVAESRPFAVLVPMDLYAFDSQEFEALARDVGARVIAYDADAPLEVLTAVLFTNAQKALHAWLESEFSAS